MARASDLRCWRCGAVIALEALPLRSADTCGACNADLHCCRMCGFYNPHVADACEETIATAVSTKDRANYCDYFKASSRAWRGEADDAEARARSELDALFGGTPSSAASTDAGRNRAELDKLFGLDDD